MAGGAAVFGRQSERGFDIHGIRGAAGCFFSRSCRGSQGSQAGLCRPDRGARFELGLAGIGATLWSHLAVLFSQIAMLVAGKVGQGRCHHDLRGAVAQAGRAGCIGLGSGAKLTAGPQGVGCRHAQAVWHTGLHFDHVLVRQSEAIGQHIA